MTFRVSEKLNAKIKIGTLKAKPLDENPFADWSAHLFVADQTQYVIVSNTKSFYSTVMYGKGITNGRQFIDRAFSSVREFMEDDGQAFLYHQFVAPSGGTIRFAKALDRVVTGSIKQLVGLATALLVEGELSPFDVGFKLNDMWLSAIASNGSEKYGKPREAFKALMNSVES